MERHKPLDTRAEQQLDRLILIQSLCAMDVGKSFLKWLAIDLCSWGQSASSSEQAALQDLWIIIRKYVPISVLGEIEHGHMVKNFQQLQSLLEEKPLISETEIDQL